jgi:hypothetical protein
MQLVRRREMRERVCRLSGPGLLVQSGGLVAITFKRACADVSQPHRRRHACQPPTLATASGPDPGSSDQAPDRVVSVSEKQRGTRASCCRSRVLRRPLDRLGAMETFVRVVDAGSFSAAARQLKIGQSAVSKTIAQLEEWLAVRLRLRSSRNMQPTEAGQRFYEL